MNIEQVDSWASQLGVAWAALDPDMAMQLVSKDSIEWYENPLEEPAKSWGEVYKLWEVIPHNQKDVSFSHKVVGCSSDYGIINWCAELTKVPSGVRLKIDGIFMISLDELGQCTFFKQWEIEASS